MLSSPKKIYKTTGKRGMSVDWQGRRASLWCQISLPHWCVWPGPCAGKLGKSTNLWGTQDEGSRNDEWCRVKTKTRRNREAYFEAGINMAVADSNHGVIRRYRRFMFDMDWSQDWWSRCWQPHGRTTGKNMWQARWRLCPKRCDCPRNGYRYIFFPSLISLSRNYLKEASQCT